MAYDDDLANRLREVVQDEPALTEKKMFGGLAFLVDCNMAVSASSKGGLLLRVDPAMTESLVSEPGVSRFEMRGRQMDGWLRVDATVVPSSRQRGRRVRRMTTRVGDRLTTSLKPARESAPWTRST